MDPKFLDFQVPRSPNFWISRFPDLQIPKFLDFSRFPDFQTPPPPDEISDPNLTPLPTHPGIKYVARALAATHCIQQGFMPYDAGSLACKCLAKEQVERLVAKDGWPSRLLEAR